jgi:hypothetical protein
MLTCKKCGTPLEKQLPECPICHEPNPAGAPVNMAGQDFTETYDPVASDFELIRQKSRKIAALLAFIVGFTGAPLFYLGYKKTGLWWVATAIILVGVAILGPIPIIIAGVAGTIVISQVILGLYISFSSNLKDARNELLK